MRSRGGRARGARFTRYHPLLGWDGVPNRSGVFRHKPVTQNSLGNRSPEVSFEKPPGVRRVLVLGDSQAWGYGVGDDETIAARLQALLDQGAERWQVANLGVSGYGTDQEYLKYLLQGIRYQPDVVVTIVFKNDVLENAETVFWGVEKPRFFFDGERLCLGNVPPLSRPCPGAVPWRRFSATRRRLRPAAPAPRPRPLRHLVCPAAAAVLVTQHLPA